MPGGSETRSSQFTRTSVDIVIGAVAFARGWLRLGRCGLARHRPGGSLRIRRRRRRSATPAGAEDDAESVGPLGRAFGSSSGACLGNWTGFITSTRLSLPSSAGISLSGFAQAGRRRGRLGIRIALTSPILHGVRPGGSPGVSGVPSVRIIPSTSSLVKIYGGFADLGDLHADHAIAVDANELDVAGRTCRRSTPQTASGHPFRGSCSAAAPWQTAPCRCSCRPAHGGPELPPSAWAAACR